LFSWLCANADNAARAGFVASLMYLAAAGVYAATLGGASGTLPEVSATVANAALRKAGFAIDAVVIRGRVHMSEDAITAALGSTGSTNIVSFDAQKAQERILGIGWIKDVEIQRIWPSKLMVTVNERQPYALWRKDSQTFAVDADGVVLGPVKPDELTGLPRLSGDGAPLAARKLFEAIAAHPAVKAQVEEAERVATRRWDLKLAGGVRAKLPENAGQALALLESALSDQTLALDQVESLDLRVDGQLAIAAKTDAKNLRQQITSSATQVQSTPR